MYVCICTFFARVAIPAIRRIYLCRQHGTIVRVADISRPHSVHHAAIERSIYTRGWFPGKDEIGTSSSSTTTVYGSMHRPGQYSVRWERRRSQRRQLRPWILCSVSTQTSTGNRSTGRGSESRALQSYIKWVATIAAEQSELRLIYRWL